MTKFSQAIFCSLLMTFSIPAFAETVRIPVGDQSAVATANKPRTGITKTTVEAEFGEPLVKNGAVGDPPISSWEYADFTVYFEYDHVIHSVAKFTSNTSL